MSNICYNIVKNFRRLLTSLKKLSEKKKLWLISKNKSIMKRLRKKNKKPKNVPCSPTTNVCAQANRGLVAPKEFSIIYNSNETLSYFNKVIHTINSAKVNQKIFFNLMFVEVITIDSIMYLISIIKNMLKIKTFNIHCSGNVPKNELARKILENSGFYDYLSPQYKLNNVRGDKITIKSGREADPVLAGEICEYVQQHYNLTSLHTKDLFTMIIELMTNTRQHAYTNNSYMKNKWYIFAEDRDKYIQFVFLDTGAGIPNTIKTNFIEKVRDKISNADAYFIASALKGEYRTETGLSHRGKGLPEIRNRVKNKKISDFYIVSGSGMCSIDSDKQIQEIKLASDLTGTLFYWRINK